MVFTPKCVAKYGCIYWACFQPTKVCLFVCSQKGQEMTTVRNKFLEYEGVSKRIPSIEKDVRIEVLRYFRHRMNPTQQRHKQDANLSLIHI